MGPEQAFLSGVGGAVRSGDRRGDAYRGALIPANEIVVRATIAGLGPPDPVCVVQNTSRLISLSPHLHDGKPRGSHRRHLPDPGEGPTSAPGRLRESVEDAFDDGGQLLRIDMHPGTIEGEVGRCDRPVVEACCLGEAPVVRSGVLAAQEEVIDG